MKISQTGINLIKEFEGCRLTAYKDSVGVLTIGYGTTNADYEITKTHITHGLTISQSTAEDWLRQSVDKKYVPKVMKYDSIYHFNQNQLDALTSFAYNIGSIDQLTNNGKRSITEISNKFLAYNKAGGKVLTGLTNRRTAEKKLFDTPVTVGWQKDEIGWWYSLADFSYYKDGWYEIENQWYYFDADGYMANDEFVKSSDYDTNKKLYWVSTDGAWNGKEYRWMQDSTGWWIAEIGGKWYSKSEWLKVDGQIYYFDDEGYMIRNRIKTINGQVYQFADDGHLIN